MTATHSYTPAGSVMAATHCYTPLDLWICHCLHHSHTQLDLVMTATHLVTPAGSVMTATTCYTPADLPNLLLNPDDMQQSYRKYQQEEINAVSKLLAGRADTEYGPKQLPQRRRVSHSWQLLLHTWISSLMSGHRSWLVTINK
ncbi:hypothetical protein Hamer_G026325 [Homarus americanus]|uniref:Uncharacterized protein n=1 Tax=Homarus americanus TaxID=6706 RepID=A0A8J5JBK0_HOMAM|nr:hypothetical protein Hamer_G026325 [Homarus americanus]